MSDRGSRPGRGRRPVRLPAWILRSARRLGLPVGEVTRYWRDEREALGRGLVALLVAATADLGAGLLLGSAEGSLENVPGLLVLIPAAIAMRGSTFGALGARLSTAIHTGQFEPELTRRGYLWRQLEAVGVLTLYTSLAAAILASLFAAIMGLRSVPVWDLVTISVLGGILASLVLVVVTVWLARAAHDRGWNMDDVGAPSITATGDLFAVPALLLAAVLVRFAWVSATIAAVVTLGTAASVLYGLRHPQADVRRLLRESVAVLTFAAAVSIMAGIVIQQRNDLFLAVPVLLVLFPPYVAIFGSLGGMLSGRLASKLHLGLIEPRPVPGKVAALDVSVTFLFAAAMYTLIPAAAWLLAVLTGLDPPGAGTLIAISLVGGLLGTALLAVVAYTAATATYRFGLDPDNHAIPIVTSTMDFLGILTLVAAMALFQVG